MVVYLYSYSTKSFNLNPALSCHNSWGSRLALEEKSAKPDQTKSSKQIRNSTANEPVLHAFPYASLRVGEANHTSQTHN